MTLNPISTDSAAAPYMSAMHVPLGMVSPLWMLFAAAASFGVAFWWMNRFAMLSPLEAIPVRDGPPASGRPKLLLVEAAKPAVEIDNLPAIANAH
ncbi:MAG: hypothetical protein Q8M88_10280 [Phenylobacterium sp.]|uniref:hypothetical protein n=1 Tax=Phenylobacterium sp. TaxID=1871053 RepID=UPI002736C362|nr:hypothetical protein [Phenylobacterium sp.]MDP3174809.1 hypothetical protein [Phenylobacterium sp.]